MVTANCAALPTANADMIYGTYKRLKVKGQHLYTATYMNMTSTGLQYEVAY